MAVTPDDGDTSAPPNSSLRDTPEDGFDAAAQPACLTCGTVMYDAPDGYVCRSCGSVTVFGDEPVVVSPTFDGPAIHGG